MASSSLALLLGFRVKVRTRTLLIKQAVVSKKFSNLGRNNAAVDVNYLLALSFTGVVLGQIHCSGCKCTNLKESNLQGELEDDSTKMLFGLVPQLFDCQELRKEES